MSWDELEAELQNDTRGLLERLLPAFIAHRLFGDPEKRRRKHERRREHTKAEFLDEVEDLRTLRKECQTKLEPAHDRGKALPDNASTLKEQLIEGLQRVATLQATLDEQYLRERERTELHELASTFDQYRSFIPVKRQFEQTIQPIETHYAEVEATAEPYLETERYLTRHHRADLVDHLETIAENLQQVEADIELSLLADADRHRVEDLKSQRTTIETHLEGYNERFVAQQRSACESLFTDIDAAGNDLNTPQQNAIIRNDTYNQVIAAAGTGKTLALIYRVAYLVTEQNVPPERIRAITYTGSAADEMETRLETQFDITEVEVSTIHSLGYEIVQRASEAHLSTIDPQDVSNFIDSVIRKEVNISDSTFHEHYLQFLAHYDETYANEADFDSKTKYIAERAEERYETLGGETVASRAEKVIADFLLMHGIEYQYEAIAGWADSAPDKGVYRPDFYLPAHDIYIEHWGIHEDGEVAEWFSIDSEEYWAKTTWGREQFEQAEYTLVETYDFEHEKSPLHLKRVLQHRLGRHGIELERLDFMDLVDYVYEYHENADIVESFAAFIKNAKQFAIPVDEIRSRLDEQHPRQYHFGRCGEILLQKYNDHLDRNDLVDFEDMIHEAIAVLDRNPTFFRDEYEHLLVDEFQDVGQSHLDFVRHLVGPDQARLFCVGDDWQSIYAFRGANVQYFTNFEEYFGPATTTYLTENYRCPPTILQAGNDLIDKNPNQIDKTVTAATDQDSTPKLHILSSDSDAEYRRYVTEHTAALIERLLATGSKPQDVMVLCRYDDAVAYLDAIRDELETRKIPYDGPDEHYRPPGTPSIYSDAFDPNAGVSVISAHRAKGREAEHVILLHVTDGYMGFPSQDRKNELTSPVRDVDVDRIAEERRLFYVAITRTADTLYVQTRESSRSPFINEINDYVTTVRPLVTPGEIGDRTTITAKVDEFFGNVNTLQRQAGYLYDGTKRVRFVSWASDDPPELEGGTWYRLLDVEVNEYQGRSQIVIRGDSNAIELYQETPREQYD